MMNKAVRAVRYTAPSAHDKNISRQALAPLWQSVTAHVNTDLLAFTSDIDPEAAVKQEGSSFIKTYTRARERLRFIVPPN